MTKQKFAMYTLLQTSMFLALTCLTIAAFKITDTLWVAAILTPALGAVGISFLMQILFWKSNESNKRF